MRLRDPQGQDLVTRTIRTREGYLVPRGEGRYVLGATVEERGWDTAPTAGATHELIRDLAEVVPGVLELEIEELGAGLRPGTPDNLPIIGEHGGVVWATGHFRNGILLADVTAQAVAELLSRQPAAGVGRRVRPRALRGGRRMNVHRQRRADRARPRRHRRSRARRPRGARPRRRGRGRRRGRPARRVAGA